MEKGEWLLMYKKITIIFVSFAIAFCIFPFLYLTIHENKPETISVSNTEEKNQEKENRKKQNIYFPPSIEIHFGMSQVEVKRAEKRSFVRELENQLEYENETDDFEFAFENGNESAFVDYFYIFEGSSSSDNALIGYYCKFTNIFPDRNYYDQYIQLRNIVTERYGEPSTEDYNWNNEFFKGDESSYNQAFANGDFTILTSWLKEDMIVFLDWDMEDGLLLKYVDKTYFEKN